MDNRFEYNIVNEDGIVEIKLDGYLDATNAYGLMEDLKKLVGTPVKKIRYEASNLEYIASAGLRVIIFSKQKIGYDADVILQNPKENVVSVVEMSGLNNFIEIQ